MILGLTSARRCCTILYMPSAAPSTTQPSPPINKQLSRAHKGLKRNGKSPAMKIAIKSLLDAGYDRKRIIDILGIRTWSNAEFGKKRFEGGLESQPWFTTVEDALARACMTNAGAAAVQVAEMLPEASALQAATVLGIMVDKTQVLRGKAVQTPVVSISLIAVKEVARLEAELRQLDAVVDMTPVPAAMGDGSDKQ